MNTLMKTALVGAVMAGLTGAADYLMNMHWPFTRETYVRAGIAAAMVMIAYLQKSPMMPKAPEAGK